MRSSRGRSSNAPASFIAPCRPTVASKPPKGPGWAHELKHDGYRLQIHIRDGRVRLYTRTGADWSKRYPLIVKDASRIEGTAILDAEVVWLDSKGVSVFEALHSRDNDDQAMACVFDLLMVNGEDLRRKPYVGRKEMLQKVLRRTRHGIQYVAHIEGDGAEMFEAVCKVGLEGMVSKELDSPYRSGRTKSWIKVKNPNAPAATRAEDGTF
jgi:bifunctional non-homologous end joining protein LigD